MSDVLVAVGLGVIAALPFAALAVWWLSKVSGNGVCQCCHRSFVDVQRHMATKHPDFAEETPG